MTILSIFIDGSDYLKIATKYSSNATPFYETLDLQKYKQDKAIDLICDLIPPSAQYILYNETDFHDRHKAQRFLNLRLIKKAVKLACEVKKINVSLVPVSLNKAEAFCLDNPTIKINPSHSYFYNDCMGIYYYRGVNND